MTKTSADVAAEAPYTLRIEEVRLLECQPSREKIKAAIERGLACQARTQREDGAWDANDREDDIGTPYSTAVAILILQLCSGNPPAYLSGLSPGTEVYPCSKLVDDIEDLIRAAARDRRTKEEVLEAIRDLIDRYRREQPAHR